MLRIRSCLVVVAALTLAAPSAAQIRQESLSLNGIDQYLSVSDDAELENLASMTIEAWVHPTSFVRFPTIVGNGFQDSYWFGFSESGHLRFYPDGGAYVEPPQTIPLDQWTHVAVAFKHGPAGLITFYINGVDVHSVGTAVTNVGSSPGELRVPLDFKASFAAQPTTMSGATSCDWPTWTSMATAWTSPRSLRTPGGSRSMRCEWPVPWSSP